MERRFAGRVALVTGATAGIGRATAVRLAAEGALVGVNQRPTGDPTETLRRIKEAGGDGFPVVADMRDPAQVIEMVQQVARRGGRLDYVVSNAAINPFMKWNEATLEDYDKLFETNVRGTWVVCTEGAKQMIKEGHGGAICMVSSISAYVGAPGQTAYCGTKGAISMLAFAWRRRKQAADRNIYAVDFRDVGWAPPTKEAAAKREVASKDGNVVLVGGAHPTVATTSISGSYRLLPGARPEQICPHRDHPNGCLFRRH